MVAAVAEHSLTSKEKITSLKKNYLNDHNVFRLVQRENVVVGCELAVGGVCCCHTLPLSALPECLHQGPFLPSAFIVLEL